VLLGFSPEAIATAVRRAVHRATTWRDYEWQLLHPASLSPVTHLALDQVLAEEVAVGRRKPTLRIWEWDEPAVVIGSFQSVRNEVDPENAAKYGIPVVRRISGGGAMFMEAGSIITYSLYAPTELVQGMSFAESYAYLDDWVLVALRSLGIEATYQPLNDIASPAGKIGGAAQKRLADGAVLHHVTMSYDIDAEKMVQVLRIGREKLSDKGTKSAQQRDAPLRSQTGLPRADIIERMVETFRSLHGLVDDEITPAEYARAEQLVAEKFGTDEWLHRVP
jgi:lipoate-protein ligase A